MGQKCNCYVNLLFICLLRWREERITNAPVQWGTINSRKRFPFNSNALFCVSSCICGPLICHQGCFIPSQKSQRRRIQPVDWGALLGRGKHTSRFVATGAARVDGHHGTISIPTPAKSSSARYELFLLSNGVRLEHVQINCCQCTD